MESFVHGCESAGAADTDNALSFGGVAVFVSGAFNKFNMHLCVYAWSSNNYEE